MTVLEMFWYQGLGNLHPTERTGSHPYILGWGVCQVQHCLPTPGQDLLLLAYHGGLVTQKWRGHVVCLRGGFGSDPSSLQFRCEARVARGGGWERSLHGVDSPVVTSHGFVVHSLVTDSAGYVLLARGYWGG